MKKYAKEKARRNPKESKESGGQGQTPISIKQKLIYCNSSFSYYSLINNLDAAAPERITDLPTRWKVTDTVGCY